MAAWIDLTANDGHRLAAWRAVPVGRPLGGLVVVQEIFGVNAHIRGVAEGFAAEGYLALAPALFDRAERGVELGYGEADIARGRALKDAVGLEAALTDVAAAVANLAREGVKVGIVGYCWGGLVAWAAACRLEGLAAAVAYYGGGIAGLAGETPRCPTLLHFGEEDHAIPLADVDKVRAAHPDLPIHLYPAGHGFSCEARASYHPESAALARQRSLDFFAEHLG